MAMISATSAYTDAQQTTTDIYKFYPLIATSAQRATSALQVFGTTYVFGVSGYNSYYVNLHDAEPQNEVSTLHAKVIATPAYMASPVILDAGGTTLKVFSDKTATKYRYTGSSVDTDYRSIGPVITRYARFIHLSGNVAYDYQHDYSDLNDVSPITEIDVTNILPTEFEEQFIASSFGQAQIVWLSAYIEQNLTEEVARKIVSNPAMVGLRLNSPGEFHSPLKVWIEKQPGTKIKISQYLNEPYPPVDPAESPVKRRIGRLVFDLDLII